jgi:hypothetical protein
MLKNMIQLDSKERGGKLEDGHGARDEKSQVKLTTCVAVVTNRDAMTRDSDSNNCLALMSPPSS